MLNASLSLPGTRLVPVSLVMKPAIWLFASDTKGLLLSVHVCLSVCACVWAYSRLVCVLPLICLRHILHVRERKPGSMRGTYSLTHYHVNTLCFLSTWLGQTREPLFSLPGHKCHNGQTPTWCSSALAQFTSSLAPQTLLLASSWFSPSVLASQKVGGGIHLWEWHWKTDLIQKQLMTGEGPVMSWFKWLYDLIDML